jgi:hypothetical protein
MAFAAGQRNSNRRAGIERLESRSLLSNAGQVFIDEIPFIPADAADESPPTVSISPALELPQVPASDQFMTIAPGSPSVTIQTTEPQFVISIRLGGDSANSDLVIDVTGLSNQGPPGITNAYLENGWIVLELAVSAPDHSVGTGTIPSKPTSAESSQPFASQHFVKQDAANRMALNDVTVATNTPNIGSQTRSVPGLEALNDNVGLSARNGSERIATMQGAQPGAWSRLPDVTGVPQVAPVDQRSAWPSSVSGLEVNEASERSPGLDVGAQWKLPPSTPGEPDANRDPSTPQSPRTNLQAGGDGMVTELVNGIKIRGVYVDPADGRQANKVVDLAVVSFEKPITVRLQLPFVMDVEDKLSEPLATANVSKQRASTAETFDAALAMGEDDSAGPELPGWPVSASVAIVAAAVGYSVGSQRRQSFEGHAQIASTGTFTPVFSELQLSQLSRRHGVFRRDSMRVR